MTDEIKQELLTIKKQMNLYISKILNKPISIPDHAYFTLTNRCNLKCVMCDIRKHPPKKLSDELTTNEIKKSIDEISEMGINHVIFSGGEPLLRKDIFELIKYSTNKVKQISLITNGLNIKKELAKRIVNSGITQITFSLDGTEKIHNNIRGSNDSYNNIIDSIKLIKLYRKKKPSIGINFTIMNSNFKNMIKILELAEKNDCDNIVFQPVMENNTDMKAQFKNKSFAVSKKNIISLKKI
ncbi:MAG: radical SAM protein, partial [Nanoarchaeota archaeon]